MLESFSSTGFRNGDRESLDSSGARIVLRSEIRDLIALNGPDATAVGLLLARTATADVVDAHVVICAQRTGQPVITSDPADLSQIAPKLQLVVV